MQSHDEYTQPLYKGNISHLYDSHVIFNISNLIRKALEYASNDFFYQINNREHRTKDLQLKLRKL